VTDLDPTRTSILDVTLELLESHGDEALQLRDVAKQARVSLSTVYKHFPSRDELVVAALERWMDAHVYRSMPAADPTKPLADLLVEGFRHLFEPWLAHPTMLTAFLRASLLPGGDRLGQQGTAAAGPAIASYFQGYDPQLARDVGTVLGHLTSGLLGQFAAGRADVAEIIGVYEVAVRRLTAGAVQIAHR
jgi:AcrR family transcriptional regulator